jgi:hypothetical protein
MLLNSPGCASHMRIARLPLSHWRQKFNHLHISYQTTFLPSFVIVARFLLGAYIFLQQSVYIFEGNFCETL